jgi:hypothetical protein
MGGENHNHLLLLILSLSLRYIFNSSYFPTQAHTNVNFTEINFHFNICLNKIQNSNTQVAI